MLECCLSIGWRQIIWMLGMEEQHLSNCKIPIRMPIWIQTIRTRMGCLILLNGRQEPILETWIRMEMVFRMVKNLWKIRRTLVMPRIIWFLFRLLIWPPVTRQKLSQSLELFQNHCKRIRQMKQSWLILQVKMPVMRLLNFRDMMMHQRAIRRKNMVQ